jgi:hypothetical protein
MSIEVCNFYLKKKSDIRHAEYLIKNAIDTVQCGILQWGAVPCTWYVQCLNVKSSDVCKMRKNIFLEMYLLH